MQVSSSPKVILVEIKGWESKRDKLKWESVSNIRILFENDLKELNII